MTTPSTTGRLRPIAATAFAICVCSIVLSACGGSSSGGSGTSSGPSASSYQSFLSFSKCMRSHGVPDFPDPRPNGGLSITPADGLNPTSPAMKAAQQTCQHLLPGGGPVNQHPTEQAKQTALKLAECMRAHGLQNFPDPTTNPPSLGSGAGPVLGIGGVFFELGSAGLNPSSPAFEQAAEACHFPGAGNVGRAPTANVNGGA